MQRTFNIYAADMQQYILKRNAYKYDTNLGSPLYEIDHCFNFYVYLSTQVFLLKHNSLQKSA